MKSLIDYRRYFRVVFSACQSNATPVKLIKFSIADDRFYKRQSKFQSSGTMEIRQTVNNCRKQRRIKSIKTNSNISATPKSSVSPTVTPTVSGTPKFKNYTATGMIKKIDVENNSVTIDHEDIGDYMVGMEMPFPVVNKNTLNDLKIGDKVEFVLETGVGVERIISIKKK